MSGDNGVRVYIASVSSSKSLQSQNMKIENVLKANDVQFELIDICSDTALREDMREKMGDPTAIPPQIFNGSVYCGNFDSFIEAVDDGILMEFLKLK